jgi:acetyl-CoA C-acetyltransferase
VAEIDPRQPVIVGAGQLTWREEDGECPSPLELMAEAAQTASVDAGVGARILARADSVACVDCFSWPVPDPAAALAERIGAKPRETVRTIISGTGPLALLGDLCARIQAGDLDVAVLAGAEAWSSFAAAVAAGDSTGWPEQAAGTSPTRLVGDEIVPSHANEVAAGLIAPVAYYPLFEEAVRAAAGRSPEEHQRHLGELWARFAAVAAVNPHAWRREELSAEEIATPSARNRRVTIPYTKLMNADIQVDQSAALVLCSAEAADAARISRDRWVFPLATAHAHDHWFMVERDALHRSPAFAACARAALGHADLEVDDLARLDLYSCFPSAVQIAAAELGYDPVADGRPPTVTGGLTFSGGPGSNYVTHSLAAMARALRDEPGAHGLVTGVGWYMTKLAAGVLSSAEPARSFRHNEPQDEIDQGPRREIATGPGEGTIEAYTAFIDRDGSPSIAMATFLLADGRRAVAKADDPDTLAVVVDGDPLGHSGRLDGDHGFAL